MFKSTGDSFTGVAIGAACLTLLLFFRNLMPKVKSLNYPPGPRPLPFLGNFFTVLNAQLYQWLAFAKLSKTYGM